MYRSIHIFPHCISAFLVLFVSSFTLANTIVNNSAALFFTSNHPGFPGNANPGNDTVINNGDGELWFKFYASGENSTLINNGDPNAVIRFDENSTGGNATIINNGGVVEAVTSSYTDSYGTVATTNYALTAGSIAGSGNFYLNNWKWTVGSNNTDTTVSGGISDAGFGSLVKVGTGTMTLLGVNTYSGGTTVSAGTLQGNSTSLQGTILNNASVVFNQTTDGTFSGAMSGIGSMTKTGAATLILSNPISYTGGTFISNGALQGDTTILLGNIVNNASLIFNQAVDGTNTAVISGSGSVIKMGAGVLILADKESYTGSTLINAGTLNLTGTLTGDSVVGPNGTLAGTGNAQNVINNGNVTPGVNATGVLQAASYAGTGTLNIFVNGASNTSLKVSGNANLTGGTLNVAGSITGPGQYDVVSAGSVTGTFATVTTSTMPFLTFGTEYSSNDVLFTVSRSSVTFTSIASTRNQGGVAAALDRAGSSQPTIFGKIISAVELLNPAQAQSAYAQMSGDALASFRTAGLGSAEHFVRQMNIRSNPGGPFMTAQAPMTQPIQLAYAGDITGMDLTQATPAPNQGLWSRAVGIFDHTDANADQGSPSSDANTGGFQSGYDFTLGDQGLLGFSGGYSKTSLTVSDRSSSGNSNAILLGLYGSYTPDSWIFDGSLSYSGISNTNSRQIAFPGVTETAAASYHSHVLTAFGEAGYTFHPLRTFAIQPTASLRESHVHQNGYTETGAPGLDLAVGDQNSDAIVSSLGVRLSRIFGPKTSHPFELGVRSAWQHELGDIRSIVSAQFADAPGASFTVQSTPESRDAAALGLDGRITLYKNVQAFLDYNATLSTGQHIQSLLGGLSLRW